MQVLTYWWREFLDRAFIGPYENELPTNQGSSRDAQSLRHNAPRGLQRPATKGDVRLNMLNIKAVFSCGSLGRAVGPIRRHHASPVSRHVIRKGVSFKNCCLIISGAFELVAKNEATRTACMLLIPTSRIHHLGFCPWPPMQTLHSTIDLTWIQFWQSTIRGGCKQPGNLEQTKRCQKGIVQGPLFWEPLLSW